MPLSVTHTHTHERPLILSNTLFNSVPIFEGIPFLAVYFKGLLSVLINVFFNECYQYSGVRKTGGFFYEVLGKKKLPEIRNTRFLVFVCPSLSRNKITCQELDQFPTLTASVGRPCLVRSDTRTLHN